MSGASFNPVWILFAALIFLPTPCRAAENLVRIDNDQARVLFVTSAPGAKSALHDHKMNRVMIYLDEGKMSLTEPSGRVEQLKFKAGQPLWSPASGMHISLNESGHPVRIVEVELKSSTNRSPAPKLGDLDPVKVDPKRYKVEFDNDQVRVIRARYEPGEKGVLHEHTLNRVVTYLTEAKLKVTTPDGQSKIVTNAPADLTWGTYARHVEENVNDKPFEVVVVEFKK